MLNVLVVQSAIYVKGSVAKQKDLEPYQKLKKRLDYKVINKFIIYKLQKKFL